MTPLSIYNYDRQEFLYVYYGLKQDFWTKLRISAMVTARFGHRDRTAASRHTGGMNLLGAVTIRQVLR